MPAADFVKEIQARKLKPVQDRLKKEKASQKYTPDPKKPGEYHSLLHVAAATGDVPILDALLAAAADVTAVDQDNNTALHWACRSDAGAKTVGAWPAFGSACGRHVCDQDMSTWPPEARVGLTLCRINSMTSVEALTSMLRGWGPGLVRCSVPCCALWRGPQPCAPPSPGTPVRPPSIPVTMIHPSTPAPPLKTPSTRGAAEEEG